MGRGVLRTRVQEFGWADPAALVPILFLLRFVFSFSDICSRICFMNPNCLKRISEDL
jgi:hypothetical protein